MSVVTKSLQGVRVVRQDPFECLISFICSSNNNIKRITLMLARLRELYGKYLCTLRWSSTNGDDTNGSWDVIYTEPKMSREEKLKHVMFKTSYESQKQLLELSTDASSPSTPLCASSSDKNYKSSSSSDSFSQEILIPLYAFPTVDELASATEEDLRSLGMGYRAKFICATSMSVKQRGGATWLLSLRDRSLSRRTVQSELLTLMGVGPKVADCVALFSLDKADVIPVDTHVWDVAVRDYDPSLQHHKSLTSSVYESVGEIFRSRFVLIHLEIFTIVSVTHL